jgi:O-antigen/teichoic acid export membrane protein
MVKGTFWSLTGAVLSRVLMLAANILVARMLTREVYGELGIIRSTVSMFIVFAGFGMGMTATKYVAEFRYTDPARAGRIMALSGLFTAVTSLIITTVLILFSPWLALHTLNAPHLTTELRIGAVILLISAMNGAQTGALAGFEAFKSIAWVNFWVGLSSFPLFVCGAYFWGLRGSVWALGVNVGVSWVLSHLMLRKETARNSISFTLKNCGLEWRILWSFGIPAMLSSIMVTPVMWLCNTFLVNSTDGYGQMAIFDAANQWRAAIIFIPGMVGQLALPMLSSLNSIKATGSYIKVLKLNLLLSGCAALIVAVPVALASPLIMKSYGAGFESGGLVLACMAASTVFAACNAIVGQAIASQGQMWAGLVFNSLWGLALVSFGYIAVSKGYGALGLALANLVAYLLHSIWQSLYLLLKSHYRKA